MFTKLSIFLLTLLINHQSDCRHFNNFIDSNEINSGNYNDEPPHTEYAKTARYVVHKSQWAAMGTISSLKEINGFPMVNIISIADSPKDGKSTGVIYFYLTDLDYTAQDLRKDNKLTVLFSNDQDLACTNRGLDPMEPTCARIMMTGKAVELDVNTKEFAVANSSFISRHPAAVKWIQTHDFFLCKLEIHQIAVLNWYGGPHYVTPEEYYKADLDDITIMDKSKVMNDENILKFDDRSSNKLEKFSVKKDRELRIKINKNTDIGVINIEV